MSGSMVKRQSDEPFFKPPREFPRRGPGGFPIGPQTKRRQKENRQLNKLPDSVKKVCETTSADWQEAARSCLPCHTHCEEKMSHQKRAAVIRAAIAKRKPTNEPNHD
jgi:hypothetical protein